MGMPSESEPQPDIHPPRWQPLSTKLPQPNTHLSGGGTHSAPSWCWSTWEHRFLSSSLQHHRDPVSAGKVNYTIQSKGIEMSCDSSWSYALTMLSRKGCLHCRHGQKCTTEVKILITSNLPQAQTDTIYDCRLFMRLALCNSPSSKMKGKPKSIYYRESFYSCKKGRLKFMSTSGLLSLGTFSCR
jgi:hypothetical protein